MAIGTYSGTRHVTYDARVAKGRISGWMWAVPVFLAGLLLLPLWLIFLCVIAAESRAMRKLVATTSHAWRRTITMDMRALKWMGGMALRASRRRGLAGSSGIALVLVPTLFAVFPHWGTWKAFPKLMVLVVWLLGAAIVVARTIRLESHVETLTERESRFEQRVRTRALRKALDAVFAAPASRLPAEYYPQVFLPDRRRHSLMPWWDPLRIGPEEGWRIDRDPPQAITGAAWASDDYVFAKGAAVSDATYGLTREQQERYERLTGVSAAPIRDAHGRPVGVLTVCTEASEPRVSEKDFVERQVALAASVAPLIIELGHLV
jgi:hypothetical protein